MPRSWGEVFTGFRDAMIMGLMLVFVVLILLFGSVFHAFTILDVTASVDCRCRGRAAVDQ